VAEKPTNLKLWQMIIAQAKAKYSTYPNPAASNWVHKKYVESGGKFVNTSDPVYKQQKLSEKQFTKQKRDRGLERKKKKGDKRDEGKK
jgi:hypothetical protein